MADTALETKLPIPESFAAEYLSYYRMLPLEIVNQRLRVAVAGEGNQEALEDLELSYGVPLEVVPIPDQDIQEAIRRTYAANESMVELVRDLDSTIESPAINDETLTDTRDLANQPPVIRFVNLLIREAHDASASDIHLEATRDGLRVRLRLDGVLTELPAPPRALQSAVISRIKLLAELDIAERRMPQDGRIRVRLESRELDLRVSTVPTLFGESVVLRLLDRGGRPVSLEELGMSAELLDSYRRLAARAHGIVLSTGPTGSGKTTTLYAALGLRRPTEEKIVTVEDPVEYHLQGITQVPVHSKAGMTFAAALRSILRQDPDVMMIGEMRDAETAGIAVQAAMTGHLVLSTLHTNDAISALTRLVDLKVEPYMIAATVEGVLAQRLVRKVCPECRESYQPEAASLALFQPTHVTSLADRRTQKSATFFRGRGCLACRQTGFRGRTGLFELLMVNDPIRRILLQQPEVGALRTAAREQGMITLKEDGWRKAVAGVTTLEEVLRVVD
jgi:type II secretory ATPase GspE/PulE/Tfp pilus assembly ATPase PilB-like protein